MKQKHLSDLSFFINRKRKTHMPVYLHTEKSFKPWLKKQKAITAAQVEQAGFKGKPETACVVIDQTGKPSFVLVGIASPIGTYDLAYAVQVIEKTFRGDALGQVSFFIESDEKNLNNAYLGWALGCYQFTTYKQKTPAKPALVIKGNIGKDRVLAEAIFLLKDLINQPANHLGPEEIEAAVRAVAAPHKAKVKVVKGDDLIKQNFPLIYTVGEASPRLPRLIELNWGNTKHPKLTLVGKGVAFDTGGLNLKPTSYMALMKKDMGGSAHALALAHLVMSLKLPVNLQLLIPAVENSVSGNAFRPGDVIKSRKGLFVENTNTDAEGRLILADTLTYACERTPELIIDFATLTGSARAALGPDIPALFSNNDKVADTIRKAAFDEADPLWPMPLWDLYKKHIESSTGDLLNSAGLPGDLIYSALFLKQFLSDDTKADWVHIDCYAWEHTGRTGRPRGGADTGLRAMLAYLEKRFAA
ncbi:MAG: leucyl aminopeptidase family protein [Alphaproteobacteria bacterium]|nr:leucyl aminopeptidase family protein [Alphaproteobacteria bacterium]MCD8526400.1 leucyl aminopeptidase family protein [Alphaproteobacteria bacterium]